MKKRFMAVLLALVLCVGLAPTTAFAADSDFEIQGGVLTRYKGPGGDVDVPSGVTYINSGAFSYYDNHDRLVYCKATEITLPNSVAGIEAGAFKYCKDLTAINVDPDNPYYTSKDGVLFSRDMTTLVAYPGGRRCDSYVIPTGVTCIEKYAFWGCETLRNVVVPSTVTEIGEDAFRSCRNLACAIFAEGFNGFAAYRYIFNSCSNLNSIAIPTSVTSIPNSALFADYLKIVYYAGDESQWSSISFGYASEPHAAKRFYNAKISTRFADLTPNAFYLDAVDWAVGRKITEGTTADTFSPVKNCTHRDILTFLWRAAGEPVSSAVPPVSGLSGTEYYYKALCWATEKGMIDESLPNRGKNDCTRADAVRYIWYAFDQPAASYDGKFKDVASSAAYAQAVAWAVKQGITEGTGNGTTFSPNKVCDRGQIVTFLYRAYNK